MNYLFALAIAIAYNMGWLPGMSRLEAGIIVLFFSFLGKMDELIKAIKEN